MMASRNKLIVLNRCFDIFLLNSREYRTFYFKFFLKDKFVCSLFKIRWAKFPAFHFLRFSCALAVL